MFIPGPPIQPLIAIQSIDDYLKEFEDIGTLKAGVGVFGSAAAYALVWELGSLRQKSPGPKTMWSVNRFGQRVILTRQAPKGYVGILEDKFWPIIQKNMAKVSFTNQTGYRLRLAMEVALDNASHEIAALVSAAAPVDSGDLRSQIQAIDTDETSLLGSSAQESSGTMII